MDSTGFQNGVSNINRQLKVVQSEFKAASSKVGGFSNSTERLKLKSESLSKQIDLQNEKVAALKKAYDNSAKTKGKDSKATQELAIKYNNAKARLSNLESEIKRTNVQIDNQTNKWKKLSVGLQSVGSSFKSIGQKMQDAGKNLTAKVTAPLSAIGIASTKLSMDFEKSSNKVATIADTTISSMEDIEKGVLSLSDSMGIAATDLNEALYQTISATGDTANALDYVEVASKAAKGGFSDTTTAVDGLTTILNAYGMKGKEAIESVSDQMLTAQNVGKTTFGEMAQSIGKVIPITASLDVSTQELFASIATLTKNGIQTSQAITGLKAAYSNILKPSKQASELALELGLKFNSAHLKSVGWAEFLDEIREKTGGNADQMATLFGSVEALNSMTVLATTGTKDFSIALDAMANSAGSTEKAFKQMDQGTKDSLKDTINMMKNLGIEIGQILSPYVNALIEKVKVWIEQFKSLDQNSKKVIVKIGLIVAAIGPALLIFGQFAGAVGNIINLGGKLISNWSTIMAVGGKMVGFLKPALGAIFSPWAIAIAGSITAGYLIIKHWDEIKAFAINLWNNLKKTFSAIGSSISQTWDSVKSSTSETWSNIKSSINEKVEGIKSDITYRYGLIKDSISVAWEQVKMDTNSSWTFIKDKINEHGGGIKGIIGAYMEAYKTTWEKGFSSISNWTKNTWPRITDYLVSPIKSAWQGINKWVDKISSAVSSAISKIKNLFSLRKKSNIGGSSSFSVSAGGASSISGYAAGTNNATRGWHWVGEEGPEIMWFNGGEVVKNHRDSMAAIGGRHLVLNILNRGNIVGSSGMNEFANIISTKIADKFGLSFGGAW